MEKKNVSNYQTAESTRVEETSYLASSTHPAVSDFVGADHSPASTNFLPRKLAHTPTSQQMAFNALDSSTIKKHSEKTFAYINLRRNELNKQKTAMFVLVPKSLDRWRSRPLPIPPPLLMAVLFLARMSVSDLILKKNNLL